MNFIKGVFSKIISIVVVIAVIMGIGVASNFFSGKTSATDIIDEMIQKVEEAGTPFVYTYTYEEYDAEGYVAYEFVTTVTFDGTSSLSYNFVDFENDETTTFDIADADGTDTINTIISDMKYIRESFDSDVDSDARKEDGQIIASGMTEDSQEYLSTVNEDGSYISDLVSGVVFSSKTELQFN